MMASQLEKPSDHNQRTYVEVHCTHRENPALIKQQSSAVDKCGTHKASSTTEALSLAYSTDKILMALGTIGALGSGIERPLTNLLSGKIY